MKCVTHMLHPYVLAVEQNCDFRDAMKVSISPLRNGNSTVERQTRFGPNRPTVDIGAEDILNL